MTGAETLSAIVELLVGGITSVATGIGSGLQTLVQSLMYTGTGSTQTLSAFATAVIIFGGISLAIGLCRTVVKFVQSLGGHKL